MTPSYSFLYGQLEILRKVAETTITHRLTFHCDHQARCTEIQFVIINSNYGLPCTTIAPFPLKNTDVEIRRAASSCMPVLPAKGMGRARSRDKLQRTRGSPFIRTLFLSSRSVAKVMVLSSTRPLYKEEQDRSRPACSVRFRRESLITGLVFARCQTSIKALLVTSFQIRCHPHW